VGYFGQLRPCVHRSDAGRFYRCALLGDDRYVTSTGCSSCQIACKKPQNKCVENAIIQPSVITKPNLWQMVNQLRLSIGRFVRRGFVVTSPVTYASRAISCASCNHRKGSRCGLCGCFIPIKTLFPLERCPDNPPRWDIELPKTYPSGKITNDDYDWPGRYDAVVNALPTRGARGVACGCGSKSPKPSQTLPILPGEPAE
jgi:hypothetical protein